MTMSGGHLGLVIVAKHRIDLKKTDMTCIHQNPHCVGLRHPELENMKTEELLEEEAMKPANTK